MKTVVGITLGLFVIAFIIAQYKVTGTTEPATMTLLGAGIAVVASLVRRHYRLKQERDDVLQPLQHDR